MPDECRKFIEEYNEEVEQLFKAFMQLVGTKDFSELHETRNSLQVHFFTFKFFVIYCLVVALFCGFILFHLYHFISFKGSVFSLTGNSDSSVSLCTSYIVPPYHEDLSIDMGLIPACPLNPVDHRGNKVIILSHGFILVLIFFHIFTTCQKLLNFLVRIFSQHRFLFYRQIYFNAYAADFWIHRSKEGLKTINFLTETDAWHLIHDFSVINLFFLELIRFACL